ncbi:MAG: hypothetical protein ACOYL6_18245 [Bacteriovoracaceae bacterium]
MLKTDRELNQFQYIFMGGIMGEILALPFVGNYLKVNQTLLSYMGIEDVDCYFPNSFMAAEKNADVIQEYLSELFAVKKKKFIIFCHSKACLEILFSLINHFPLFEKMVEKVICVNPPFQGSSLFDNHKKHWFGRTTYPLLRTVSEVWPGLKCLEKGTYADKLTQGINGNLAIKAWAKEKLLVVTGAKQDSSDVSWVIRLSHEMMGKNEPSDGLVKLTDQILPDVEYKKLHLNMDHSDFFTSTNLSNKNDKYREHVLFEIIKWASTEVQEHLPNPKHTDSELFMHLLC